MGIEELPKKMKAIQVVEFNKPYEIREIDVPTNLQPDDILVKVAVASNCHTDGMVLAGVMPAKLPQTASHEGSGTVIALGSKAKERGFKEGMRVMCGIPLHPCGKCGDCTNPNGDSQYCGNLEGHIGVTTQGCFADYVVADSRSSTPLPDEVTHLSSAPLACAGRTVWRSVLQTGLKKGEWVCIVGSGGGLGYVVLFFGK